jgi:murein DD-endopeptidase MepM/ murein hydrolase activator NlpD
MRTQAQTLPTVNKTILANIVQSEFGSLEEGDLVEEVFNEKEVALQFKSAVNQANSLSLKAPLAVTQQGFVEFKETENNPDALSWSGITPNLMASEQTTKNSSIQIVKKRDKIITYVVQPGDTVSTIAQKFGLTVNTILWENNLSPYSLIHPGDKLSILPVSGVTHTVKKGETIGRIARDYGVKIEKILEANHLKITSTLAIGQKLIIPDGRKRTYVARKTKTYSGISVIKKLVQTPRRSPAVSSNKMAWPTVGHRITQYFSWRHNGLDIANRIGTPIFAADAGVIEYAGWGRGYGNYILINHGGGKKTRYAHLSRFYVSKGQKVAKGQTIAAMGSTGWSTGPHLHFEVIINGRRYNPLNYIR